MADNNNVGHECPTYDPVTTDPAPHQLPPDPGKSAAIEAAKARAAARKAARLAQNSEAKTPAVPTSTAELPPPSQDAPAPTAGEGWGGGSALHSSTNAETSADIELAPHQLPSDPGKTAAIEAAKARAAARKAARLAQQPLNEDAAAQHPQPPPQPSPTGGGSLSVAEPPTDAETSTELLPPPQRSAAGEGWGGGSVLHSGTNAETSTNVKPTPHPENNKQPEASPMTDDPAKQSRDAKLAAARAKSAERRIAHAKLKQHMRDTAIPIRPQTDDRK